MVGGVSPRGRPCVGAGMAEGSASEGGEVPAGRRALLGAALGAALTLGVARCRGRIGARAPGEVAIWAADRAGGQVVGLDADGLVRCVADVPAPVALRQPGGGRRRVRRSGGGATSFGAAIVAVSASASRRSGPRRDVVLDAGGRILWSGPTWCGSDAREQVQAPKGWRCGGEAERARLERIVDGRRVFSIQLDFPVGGLASAPAEGLWVASARSARVVRLTGTGRVVLDVEAMGEAGCDAVLAATPEEGGGVWVGAGGALLRFDRHGRRLPGQGGFWHLCALERVRRRR